MGYQGTDGFYTVFPTGKKPNSSVPSGRASSTRPAPYGRTAAGAIRSKPCAHGPSPARGNCPKKARTAAGQAKQQIKAITRAAGAPKGGGVETVLTAAGGAAASSLARTAKGTLRGAAGAKAVEAVVSRIGPKALAAIGVSGIGLVGLASYFITKRFLEGRAARRESRADEAFRISQAYRAARQSAEELNGGPLSLHQHTVLADAFKAQLAELGLSTDNLKGL